MDRTPDRVPPALVDDVFSCLAHPARRFVLSCVAADRSRSICRDDLETAFVGWHSMKPREDASAADQRQANAALRHLHLPALEEAGFVREVDNLIVVDGHPALLDPGIKAAMSAVGDAEMQPVFQALADAERRAVLDVLSHQYRPIHVEELARELAARSSESTGPAAHERIHRRLHHVQLPLLADAGLISRDDNRDLVGYTGSPALRIPWIHSFIGPEFRTEMADSTEEVATIEGREQVVSCGQSMLDEATDEVFMLITATGLLEAGCFAEITEAVERGVDVYLGTADPAVREYVEAKLPEIIIWEPHQNWVEIPLVEDTVGRLVVVDGKMVMIGSLRTADGEDRYEERAIIAEGEDNLLVTLLRHLVDEQRQGIERATEEGSVPALF